VAVAVHLLGRGRRVGCWWREIGSRGMVLLLVDPTSYSLPQLLPNRVRRRIRRRELDRPALLLGGRRTP
jgi:hypothetical protein